MDVLARPGMLLPALLVALIIVLGVPMMAPLSEDSHTCPDSKVFFPNSSKTAILEVELARTPQEHSTGLMNRESLPVGIGMLFIFREDSPRSFWMKDTLIPLDMIFINSSLDIVHLEVAHPCPPGSSCPLYNSGEPAMYVVEANAGFAAEYGIEAGQKVTLEIA